MDLRIGNLLPYTGKVTKEIFHSLKSGDTIEVANSDERERLLQMIKYRAKKGIPVQYKSKRTGLDSYTIRFIQL
jgi:hypothetical protein